MRPAGNMPRDSAGARGRSRDRRGRGDGRRRKKKAASASRSRSRAKGGEAPEGAYWLELAPGREQEPFPMYELLADDAEGQIRIPHVCSQAGEAYVIRVNNSSSRHIACSIKVDAENALLKDGSLIVAPGDTRELPGFLVSKNFIGKEYIKEYRNFVFGKPTVVEASASGKRVAEEEMAYKTYGSITCDVFEAVLDEEVDSDVELSGQTTFYRGAGLNGSFDERKVPEGKQKHFMYSAVTVQGPRSSIANSTRGRWWVRGTRKLRSLEVRYRESHSLMLLGVSPEALGIKQCKEEDDFFKKEDVKDEDGDGYKREEKGDPDVPRMTTVDICDLTEDTGVWTVGKKPKQAAPVDVA